MEIKEIDIKPKYEQLKTADLKASRTNSTHHDELTQLSCGLGLFELVCYCASAMRIDLGGSL